MTLKDKREKRGDKEKDNIKEALKLLSEPALDTGGGAAHGHEQQLDLSRDRQRAARKTDNKPDDKNKPQLRARMGNCPTCGGLHPECSNCPNESSAKDSGFDAKFQKEKGWFCNYRHCGGKKHCTGQGHIIKRHFDCHLETAKAEVAKYRLSDE